MPGNVGPLCRGEEILSVLVDIPDVVVIVQIALLLIFIYDTVKCQVSCGYIYIVDIPDVVIVQILNSIDMKM